MLLAELEIFHSRTNAPTRRVALGYTYLPIQKGSGNGAVLLAGIVARFIPNIDEDFYDDYKKLLYQLQRGESCLLYTSPSPRDKRQSRMPSSA